MQLAYASNNTVDTMRPLFSFLKTSALIYSGKVSKFSIQTISLRPSVQP